MRRGSVVQLVLFALVAGGVATAVALVPGWLPTPAGREAGRIDFVFWFVTVICIAIFAVVAAAIAYSIWKFRAAPDDESDGPPTDPDEPGAVDPEAVRCARDWVARHLDGAGSEPLRTETCLYTNMPDESFVLERHGRIVVGSPCSGHGFKFAPLVGRELAALAVEALG